MVSIWICPGGNVHSKPWGLLGSIYWDDPQHDCGGKLNGAELFVSCQACSRSRAWHGLIPSGNDYHSYGKAPCLMEKSTINGPCSIAILVINRGYHPLSRCPQDVVGSKRVPIIVCVAYLIVHDFVGPKPPLLSTVSNLSGTEIGSTIDQILVSVNRMYCKNHDHNKYCTRKYEVVPCVYIYIHYIYILQCIYMYIRGLICTYIYIHNIHTLYRL